MNILTEEEREEKYRVDSERYLRKFGRPLSRRTFEACNPRAPMYTPEQLEAMKRKAERDLELELALNHDPADTSDTTTEADTTTVHHEQYQNVDFEGDAYAPPTQTGYESPDEQFRQDDSDAESLAGSDDFSRMMILDAGETQSGQPRRRRYPYSYSADDDRRWQEYERGNPNAFSAPLPPGHPLRGRRFGSISSSDSEPMDELLKVPLAFEGTTLFTKRPKPRPWWELYRDPEFHPQTTWVVPEDDLRPRADNEESAAIHRENNPPSLAKQELEPASITEQKPKSYSFSRQRPKPTSLFRREPKPSEYVQPELEPSPIAGREPPSPIQREDEASPLSQKRFGPSSTTQQRKPIELYGLPLSPANLSDIVERARLLKERGRRQTEHEEPQPSTPTNQTFNWDLTNSPEPVMASTPAYSPPPQPAAIAPERVSEEIPKKHESPDDPAMKEGTGATMKKMFADAKEEARREQAVKKYNEQMEHARKVRDRILAGPDSPPLRPGRDGSPPDDMRKSLGALAIALHKQSQMKKCPEQPPKPQPPGEDRQQEINQLRSMSARLHSASRSIRDAYNNAKQLVNSVDMAGPATPPPCEHCGCINHSPAGMILSGTKRLLFSSNSEGQATITWFGVIFSLLLFWYLSEIALTEFFGTNTYATTMNGYGVYPDRPRYPFAIITLLSWIPPVNWMLAFLKSHVVFEATRTVAST